MALGIKLPLALCVPSVFVSQHGWDMVMGPFPSSLGLHLRSSRCCWPFKTQLADSIQRRLWAVDSADLAEMWFLCSQLPSTVPWRREEGRLPETQFISTVLWLLFLLRSFAKYHGTGSSDHFALEFPNSIRESIQPFSPFLGLGPSRIPGRCYACIHPPGSLLSFPHPLLSFARLVEIFSFQC